MSKSSTERIAHRYLKQSNLDREFKNILRQMKQIEVKNNQLEDYTEVVEDFFGFRLAAEAMTTFKEILAKFNESKKVRDNADKVIENLKATLELVQQTGNTSLAKKIQSALVSAEKQAEKASKNREKLRKTLIRVEAKAFPKTVVDNFKPFYKEMKKYISNIPPLRDASKRHRTNGQWRMMLALTDNLSFGIVLETSGEYKHIIVHDGWIQRFTTLKPAREWLLENGEMSGVTIKNNPNQEFVNKRQEIVDVFKSVIRYYDGNPNDVFVSGKTIRCYTGDSGHYEEYDGDGAGWPIEARFERALKPYKKYIEGISVQWYGDGEWVCAVELK
jgi:hypothetical protein